MQPTNFPDAGGVVGHPGPIPGERDPETLTHAEPGSLGGGIAGERILATHEPIAMGDETRREIERDCGGK